MWNQRRKIGRKRDKFDFKIRDDVWDEIVPDAFHNRVVCLSCFDSEIAFAGDMDSFSLRRRTKTAEPEVA